MKAFRMYGIGDLRLVDIPEPAPGVGEVLLRPLRTGICATDLHVLYHGAFQGDLPLTLGHEFSAEVVALGADIVWEAPYPQSCSLTVGDRVCVEPVLPCNRCDLCLGGRVNLCQSMRHLGISQDGSLAELVRAPASRCTRLPDALTDEEGALVEVLACGVNFVEKAAIRPGDVVAVVGGGPMGQMAAMVSLAGGAGRVIVSDLNPERRAVALRMGAHDVITAESGDPAATLREMTGGRGADVVLECVGLERAVQQALDMMRRGGRCVLGGLSTEPLHLRIGEIVFGEQQVLGAVASAWHFGTAISLLVDGKVAPAGIISTQCDFVDAAEAVRTARDRPDLCKLMIRH